MVLLAELRGCGASGVQRRVDAAVAAHEAKMRLKVQAGYNTRDDNTLEYMLADDVDEVEKEMLRSYVFKMEKYGEFMATRDKEGKLIVKPVPTPESEVSSGGRQGSFKVRLTISHGGDWRQQDNKWPTAEVPVNELR